MASPERKRRLQNVTATMNGTVPGVPRDAAYYYFGRGLLPIPVPLRGKECFLTNWPALRRRDVDLDAFFPEGLESNVGVMTGAPSGGLTDIDLDAPEAAAAADHLLPPTGWVFGRRGKPR